MVSRRVAWGCGKCRDKGWRVPVFKDLKDLEWHSVQKHKEAPRVGAARVDVVAFRVDLWPEETGTKKTEGDTDTHGSGSSSDGSGNRSSSAHGSDEVPDAP